MTLRMILIVADLASSADFESQLPNRAAIAQTQQVAWKCEYALDTTGERSFHGSWPDNLIPFEFEPDITATERQQMLEAMDLWGTETGAMFVHRNGEQNYIRIGRNCREAVSSYSSGQLSIWSGYVPAGCPDPCNGPCSGTHWNNQRVLAHELGHALGWAHEQERPDRDNYVTINSENITAGDLDQFEIATNSQTFGHPYDYGSIMHYGACTFSDCSDCSPNDPNCRTITTHDPSWQDDIGHANSPSFWDLADVRVPYGPRIARYVAVSGTGNGSLAHPMGSISGALAEIPPHGVVILHHGEYNQAGLYSTPSTWRTHAGGSAVVH